MSAALAHVLLVDTQALLERARTFWGEAVDVWVHGGPAMVAIAANAFLLFAIGLHIQLALRERGFLSLSERKVRTWIEEPDRHAFKRLPIEYSIVIFYIAQSV